MDIQRLRNLTTGILHTKMGHVYQDLEMIVGQNGLMTHMIPNMIIAVQPWLKESVADKRFWNDKYDTTHTGEIELPIPSTVERNLMIDRYHLESNPLEKVHG